MREGSGNTEDEGTSTIFQLYGKVGNCTITHTLDCNDKDTVRGVYFREECTLDFANTCLHHPHWLLLDRGSGHGVPLCVCSFNQPLSGPLMLTQHDESA